MNKFILTLLMIAWLCAAMASDTAKIIPGGVTSSFKTRYPDATHVSWLSNGGNYAARFYSRGEPCTARFNKQGEWLDETKKLSFGDLRNNVRNAFSQSKFASWHAHEVNAIQSKDKKEVEYRILILNDNAEKKYIYYDAKGQLTKQELTL